MKHEYDKRIAFVISSQHFIAHGGIGSFAKSFLEMSKNLNWKVDYILDKAPQKTVLTDYINDETNIIFADEMDKNYQKYSVHSNTFVFSDSMHLERMLNFRIAMMKAFRTNLYDMIIVNSVDAVSPIYFLGLSEIVPVVYYTHSENLIFLDLPHNKVFNKSAVNYMKHEMTLPSIKIGTQSQVNANHIKKHYNDDVAVYDLPMQIPELKLMDVYDIEKDGVMFIGRFEPRKQPKLFADIIKKTGLKAKILTNENGKNKFEEYFKSIDYDNYEIKAGIIGDEKVEFIKSAKLGFHTASLESYGFSVFETLHSCPTVCLEEYSWWKNFDGLVELTNKADAHKVLKKLYDEEFDEEHQIKIMKKHHQKIAEKWKDFLEQHMLKNLTTTKTDIIKKMEMEECTRSLHDYYFDILDRNVLAIDDVISVYKKYDDLNIYQFDDGTYIDLKIKNKDKHYIEFIKDDPTNLLF